MRLRIYGNPVPQGRPRAFRRGNFIGMYDPKNSKEWKETIRWQAIHQQSKLLQGAIKMNAKFILERPKSLAKKVVYHIKRPDLDNLVKAVKDALRGICYHDDSQIIELCAKKLYTNGHSSLEHIHAGVIIEIEKIE